MEQVRSWNYDRAEVSDATALYCEDPSRTIQSQADEANINTIVKNFGVTGQLPASVKVPMYGDFTDVGDYREALEAVKNAEANFMALPAELRKKLDHDPQRFLEYCLNPENLEEMRKLGLALEVSKPTSAPSGSEAS